MLTSSDPMSEKRDQRAGGGGTATEPRDIAPKRIEQMTQT